MKILALDFSTLRRSASILEISNGDAELVCETSQESLTQRAGSPFPLLDQLFRQVHRDEIEGIAVGLGPGSYTGIRSALAIAQGWHLSRNIPATGVSSSDAIACEAWRVGTKGPIEVVIDAQRNEVYSAVYHLSSSESDGATATRPLAILARPLGQCRLVGPEATKWDANGLIVYPTGFAIGKLARRLEFVSPEKLEPIYLREPSFLKAPAVPRP